MGAGGAEDEHGELDSLLVSQAPDKCPLPQSSRPLLSQCWAESAEAPAQPLKHQNIKISKHQHSQAGRERLRS